MVDSVLVQSTHHVIVLTPNIRTWADEAANFNADPMAERFHVVMTASDLNSIPTEPATPWILMPGFKEPGVEMYVRARYGGPTSYANAISAVNRETAINPKLLRG